MRGADGIDRAGSLRCLLAVGLLLAAPVAAARRVEVAEGQVATLVGARDLYLEAAPEKSEGLLAFARRLCGTDAVAQQIAQANGGVRILELGVRYKVPFELLRPEYQVRVLDALFDADRPTARGWEHVVSDAEREAPDALARLADWFTGDPGNAVVLAEQNGVDGSGLAVGQSIVIPPQLLRAHLRGMLPRPPPADLEFGKDEQGEYAVYRLKAGEALYSAVVVRFTGNVYADDVNALAKEVAERSGIRDVTDIPIGFAVKIPFELMLPEFLPADHPRRIEYEKSLLEAAKFGVLPKLSHLDGVTVILDSGHGGKDVGASHGGVWESLYVYDIMVRTKRLLEETTAASVVATTRDGSSFRFEPRDVLPFSRGHQVLTTPAYPIEDASVGAHLRWYLSNSVYRHAMAAHGDPAKVLFLSIHADSLHPSLRGAMVYIPGAEYCGGSYGKSGAVYAARREVREQPRVSFSGSELNRSEGWSRELAQRLIESFHDRDLAVHEYKPIREKIIRNRRSWVPAVLRYNEVPAKLLFEVCNLANSEDRRLIQTQAYRQRVAEAIVDAILAYYGHGAEAPTRVAAGG